MMPQVGLNVRTALSSSIYRKSLRLSNRARGTYSAGEIVNLISVDCQKLQDTTVFLAFLWSVPLQVGRVVEITYNVILDQDQAFHF